MEEAPRPLALRVRALLGDPVHAVGVVALAVVVAIVAIRLPQALGSLDDESAAFGAAPAQDREFRGAHSVGLEPRVFVVARTHIPAGATYYVATGPKAGATSATLFAAAPFARYYLLPRRQTPDPAGAQWIVSYGADLDALGLRYARRIDAGTGLAVAEVAR